MMLLKKIVGLLIIFGSIFFQLQAQNARMLTIDTTFVSVEKIDILNSQLRETNLSVTPNGKNLFFMSNRGGQKWSQNYGTYKNQMRYDGDIWFSEKADSVWKKPVCLSNEINTANGEDEPNISQDGQSVFFQSWNNYWKQTGGPYYQAELNGNRWENVRGLGGGINTFFVKNFLQHQGYATDGMSVSPAQDLFLVACAPQYEDKMDLFWSKKGENGQWNEPTKCPVSTSEDERSVFVAADGKTVFFASDGYGGLGGLDILKTTLNPDGTFGEIINPGRPFNSEGDDYNFIINAAGDEAFFVRDGDIFRVIFKKPSPLSPAPVALIEGIITEGCDKKPLSALISFIDAETDLPVVNLRSNSMTGKFSFVVNCRKEGRYRLRFMHKEREIKKSFVPETFDVFKHYEINFHLDCAEITPEKSPKIDTLTVFFDFNSEMPQTSYHERLSILAQNLISNRQKVNIIGHTDNKGSFAFNHALALRRAEQIKNFLILKGVHATNIKISGKSFSEPAKANDTDEGRASNRRAILIVE